MTPINRQHYLEYQRWYNTNIRSKQQLWYKRSPEAYAKHLKSLHKRNRKMKEDGIPFGYYFYKAKRDSFINQIGKCQICGYDNKIALVFHHSQPFNDRKANRYGAKGITKAIQEGKAIILCANCHMLVHKGIVSLLPME